MSYAGGIIQAPVSIDDVVAVLGENTYNLAELCHSPRVNKWAKYKPTKGFSYEPLTEAQFRGTTTAQNRGIVYGLNCGVRGFLTKLHECDYAYARVFEDWKISNDLTLKGSDDWGRLTDFDGYNHYAAPEITGNFNTDNGAVYDIDRYLRVDFSFNLNAPDSCVRLSDIIENWSADVAMRLPNMYPCALVTIGSKSWVRAMYWRITNSAGSQKGETGTLTSDGTNAGAWRNVWYIPFSELSDAKPDVSKEDPDCYMTVTVFFCKTPSHTVNGAAQLYDFLTKWAEVSDQSILPDAQVAFTCPEAVNRTVALKPKYRPGLRATVPFKFGNNIVLPVFPAKSWSAEEYTITAYLDDDANGGGHAFQHTFVTEGSDSGTASSLGNITLIRGVFTVPGQIPVYHGHWVVTCKGYQTNSGTF